MKGLVSLFLHGRIPEGASREGLGAACGALGIVCNAVLCLMKFALGLFSGSISILADAVNNLTDCATGAVTLFGFRICARPADEKHPYGHARSEHIAALLVCVVLLAFSLDLFGGSVEKLFDPARPAHVPYMAVMLVSAVLVKALLAAFYFRGARALSSEALLAAARDSVGDAVITSAILFVSLFNFSLPFSADGLLGALIALWLFFAGLRSLKDTLDPLLGVAPARDFTERIEEKLLSFAGVLGVHDLVVHSYGVSRHFASVHVEVDAGMTLLESHELIDGIEREFALSEGLELVIHPDPVVTDDPLSDAVREKLCAFVATLSESLRVHDFRMVHKGSHKLFVFDITVPAAFSVPDEKIASLCRGFLSGMDAAYEAAITVDRGFLTLRT